MIRDNIVIEPETLTEILWLHDRQEYYELEVRISAAPNTTPIAFTALSWYFNHTTICNQAAPRFSNPSNTPNITNLIDPWTHVDPAQTTTQSDSTSPYVDTTISPHILLSSGHLESIAHPASIHIDPAHIHRLSVIFRQFVCSPNLSDTTNAITAILLPDADQTLPKESQLHEVLPSAQPNPL